MFEQMLAGFATSDQGKSALSALQQQGISATDAQSFLTHAVPAAAESMHQQTAGQAQPTLGLFNIFGGHAGKEFLLSAVAGLLKGDGIVGSLEDGGMGVIGGHIGEVVANRMGWDQDRAGKLAAVATPFIVSYVHSHLSKLHA
jgi:hypothetical protein